MQLGIFLFEDDSVHSIHGSIIVASWEELFALDGAGYNIAYKRISLRQIRRKVHLFPLKSFPDAESRKTKVRTNGGTFDKVKKSVYRIKNDQNYLKIFSQVLTQGINVDRLRMLLLIVLLDAEYLTVAVLILQYVSVLLALKPRVL